MMQLTGRVLVVDDDPGIRKLVRKCLEAMGLKVEEASCGRTAITQLEHDAPELVCLDLMLPELSGYDVCEHIRRTPRLQRVRVLMMSARAHPVDRAYAEEAGAAAYLTKPFTIAEFTSQVSALLSDGRAA
jgi:two-component system chemotaxis response regulator CheY